MANRTNPVRIIVLNSSHNLYSAQGATSSVKVEYDAKRDTKLATQHDSMLETQCDTMSAAYTKCTEWLRQSTPIRTVDQSSHFLSISPITAISRMKRGAYAESPEVSHHTNRDTLLSTATMNSNNLSATASVESIYESKPFINKVEWTANLFKWFVSGSERTHRYAAYIFGHGGEGKTRVVRALVEGKNVFECRLTERYAFEGFNSDIDILLIDEVNWVSFEPALRSTLLNIMARQPSVIQRKYKPQITIENNKVLTIFTSNYKLPCEVAFRRRCYVIWAKQKACVDAVPEGEDDPGDDDSAYVNPKSIGAYQPNTATTKAYRK
jgi:hypothetical protein